MSLRVYNTIAGSKEAFVPVEPGKVKMYVCGVTVYDHCHIGHARANVVFDGFTAISASLVSMSPMCATTPTSMTRSSTVQTRKE